MFPYFVFENRFKSQLTTLNVHPYLLAWCDVNSLITGSSSWPQFDGNNENAHFRTFHLNEIM